MHKHVGYKLCRVKIVRGWEMQPEQTGKVYTSRLEGNGSQKK